MYFVELIYYRYSNKTVNLYTSKIHKSIRYFNVHKLSFTIGNLYRNSKDKLYNGVIL